MSEQFIDAEGQGVAQGGSFKEIINRHIERILVNSSTEFGGGYFKEIPTGGATIRIWVPDELKTYGHSVLSLADALHAHYEDVNKDISTAESKINEYIKESFNNKVNPFKGITHRYELSLLYRKLFRVICDFLKSKNYLELGGYTDE